MSTPTISPPLSAQTHAIGEPPTGRSVRKRAAARRLLLMLALLLAAFGVLVAVSIVGALRVPGNESFRAKWADWLRDHHGTVLVTALENWYFDQQQPARGGQPNGLNT